MSPADFLQACSHLRILVLGDLMLDRYLWGKVDRISPEAPVPVVDVYAEENRLGGAANVALNLHSMGATPVLCGLLGQEEAGEQLLALAQAQGWDSSCLFASPHRRTTVKVRLIGNGQQVMRVDKEDRFACLPEEQQWLEATLLPRLAEFDAIVLQDYDKGLLSPALIQRIIQAATAQGVPTLVDPKFRQFWAYEGCTLFKPNLKELNEGLGQMKNSTDLPGLETSMQQLRARMPHGTTLVTLGANGALLMEENGHPQHLSGHPRAVADVSGAGDTVIAMLALGLGAKLSAFQAAQYANLAGGLVCEEVGVVPIDPTRWVKEAIQD